MSDVSRRGFGDGDAVLPEPDAHPVLRPVHECQARVPHVPSRPRPCRHLHPCPGPGSTPLKLFYKFLYYRYSQCHRDCYHLGRTDFLGPAFQIFHLVRQLDVPAVKH